MKKKIRIKIDDDGTEMIIIDQEMVKDKNGGTVIDVGKLQFPVDRFGKIKMPKKGEILKMKATFEDKEGEWEEV